MSPQVEMVRPASMPCLPALLATSSTSNLAGAVVVGLQPPRLRRSVSHSEVDVEPYRLPTADDSGDEGKDADGAVATSPCSAQSSPPPLRPR